MYGKLECCRLISDAVKIALKEAVFWLWAQMRWDVCCSAFFFLPPTFSWRIAQGRMSLNWANVAKSDYCKHLFFVSICLFFPCVIPFSKSQLCFGSDTRTFHLGIITSLGTNRVWHNGVSAAVQSQLSSVPRAQRGYTREHVDEYTEELQSGQALKDDGYFYPREADIANTAIAYVRNKCNGITGFCRTWLSNICLSTLGAHNLIKI